MLTQRQLKSDQEHARDSFSRAGIFLTPESEFSTRSHDEFAIFTDPWSYRTTVIQEYDQRWDGAPGMPFPMGPVSIASSVLSWGLPHSCVSVCQRNRHTGVRYVPEDVVSVHGSAAYEGLTCGDLPWFSVATSAALSTDHQTI